nr:MAG TPA: occlusion protein [Siphoviridae sp. ctBxQ4]
MKVEQVKLSQVKLNGDNPRIITKEKFGKLINSILVLPKMLELRPIVVDGKMSTLGGNMRTEALRAIAKMSAEDISARLLTIAVLRGEVRGRTQGACRLLGKMAGEADSPCYQRQ